MSLAQSTLVQRVRRILGDTPLVQLGSTTNASTTTVTVSDSSKFSVGAVLEFQSNGEQVMVKSITNATTIEVWSRGFNGTTAQTQSSGLVYIDPEFTFIDITNALDRTIQSLWPYAWKKVDDTITPSSSEWFDLGSDAIDLIQVLQRYGVDNESLAVYGERDTGLPVRFRLNVPTTLCASGVGLQFPHGFAHSINTVSVSYRAKITTTQTVSGTYDDLSEGLMAEAVVYGAAGKVAGFKEIPYVNTRDIAQGYTGVGPQARLTTAQWLAEEYRKCLNQLRDELMRTIPPMSIWS